MRGRWGPSRGRSMLGAAVLACSAAAALATPVGAEAGELLSTRVTAARAAERNCTARPLGGTEGTASRSVVAPAAGWFTARLSARNGDWDLGVFDARSGRRVAGSSSFGSDEVAQGLVARGEALVVQACRRSGSADRAELTVGSQAVPASRPQTLSLVRVSTPTSARKSELAGLGLDLTEHGGRGFVEVVLHGAADARKLRKANFVYTAEIADLARQSRLDRAADARYARSVTRSSLPSGRDSYRHLDDYTNEMKQLVAQNPDLVKPLTLPFKTFTGRSVEGIEITTDVNARDGKPVFLQLGAHHAREWPSSEHAMEWAYELVKGYNAGDPRVTRLVSVTRTIVIPVVNPDGFNTSREAAGAMDDGRGGPDETPNLAIPYEYQRKNCRIVAPDPDPPEGDCTQPGEPNVGLEQFGVDPNRNYGSFWGGPGASPPGGTPPGDYAQDYRGNGPFSEPETQNIRSLVSTRQVTTLITNHTFSDLVLRPPGIQVQGPPPDEEVYKALGDAMAAQNGYASERGYQLYDTTGTTEDWSYYVTGGLGFTFEIGPTNFHPPYADVVAEYEGTTEAADKNGDGKGNREAYFIAQESTADTSRHSVLEGTAPGGAVLRLTKAFKTRTSPVIDADGNEGDPIEFGDTLDSAVQVPSSGRFEWHVNPSTRPIAAQSRGRDKTGDPSPPMEFSGNAPAAPCGAATPDPTCYRDFPFTVPTGAGIDNAKASVEVTWATPASDYDVTVYKDTNGDGSSDGEPDSAIVGSSAQGATNSESTSFGEPAEVIAGNKYVVRVLNFAGAEPFDVKISLGSPEPFQPGTKESWTLTCELPEGNVLERRLVEIDRGQRQSLDLAECARAAKEQPPAPQQQPQGRQQGAGCDEPTGRLRGTRLDRARLGGRRTQVVRSFASRTRPRSTVDRFCLRGGGAVRVGYPSSRLRRSLTGRERGRYTSDKAVLILTSSNRFALRGLRVGASAGELRKRLGRRARGIRVGANGWYLGRGSRARLVFKLRDGRVGEIGIADRRLTRDRARAKRFLASFG